MSLAEQLKEEGRIEGELRGELRGERRGELRGELKKSLEIAKRMLDAGSDPVFVSKVTGLSLDKIKALQNKG